MASEGIDLLAERLVELGERMAEPGTKAALEAARTQAYSALASGALWLSFGLVTLFIALLMWRRADSWKGDDLDVNGWRIGACIVIPIGGIIVAASLWAFVDPWVWTTIQHPELWIAKRMLGL